MCREGVKVLGEITLIFLTQLLIFAFPFAFRMSFEVISNSNESELEKLLQSKDFDWRQFPMLSPGNATSFDT